MHYQQGDVIVERISECLPESAKEQPHRILAEGEATGHCHEVVEKELSNLYLDESGNMFLKADGNITLKHQEHKAIIIPKGLYRIRKVREYDHFEEEARQVRD